MEDLFKRISVSASPYTWIVQKTLHSLWTGSAGLESSKIELTLAATVLINEICRANDLPQSEIIIADGAFPRDEEIKNNDDNNYEESMEDIELPSSPFSPNKSTEEVHCPVVDTDVLDPSGSNPISTTQTPREVEYLCQPCNNKNFSTQEEVFAHCMEAHPSSQVPVLKVLRSEEPCSKQQELSCAHCDFDDSEEGALESHLLKEHQNISRTLSSSYSIVIKPKNPVPKKKKTSVNGSSYLYKCHKCKQGFRFVSSYLRHKMQLHCSVGGKGGEQPFKCPFCDKAWMYKYLLEEHVRLVHRDGDKGGVYSCNICGKKGFRKEYTLEKHKEKHVNKFSCDSCEKTFSSAELLESHLQEAHPPPESSRSSNNIQREEVNPFCCHLCGKSSSSNTSLRLHIARHYEDRPKFVCELCGKEFLYKGSLRDHVRYTHKKVPLEDKLPCHLCNRSFGQRKVLNKHIKLVHNKIFNYRCELCGREFGTATHLKTHKTTVHDKIYEYRCHLCPSEYLHQQSLKKHLSSAHDIVDFIPARFKLAK